MGLFRADADISSANQLLQRISSLFYLARLRLQTVRTGWRSRGDSYLTFTIFWARLGRLDFYLFLNVLEMNRELWF